MGRIITTVGGGSDVSVVTAEASDVIKDKVIVDKEGEPVVGTLAIQDVISFSAAAQSSSVIRISWKNPSKGPWTGVKIRLSTTGNPGVSGGELRYSGYGNTTLAGAENFVDITNLAVGTKYYFTCYSYVTGLGDSTTGYNVSATTKGLIIYNGGAIPSNIKLNETNSETMAGQWYYNDGIVFNYTDTIDMSKYTKFCIVTHFDWVEEDFVRFLLNGGDSGSKAVFYTYALNKKYTVEIPLKSTGTGTFYLTVRNNPSSTGGTDGDVNGVFHKMWFE